MYSSYSDRSLFVLAENGDNPLVKELAKRLELYSSDSFIAKFKSIDLEPLIYPCRKEGFLDDILGRIGRLQDNTKGDTRKALAKLYSELEQLQNEIVNASAFCMLSYNALDELAENS